jgi:hypothetical protein
MIVASVMPVAEWQVRHRFDADFLAFRGDPPQLLVVFRAACLTVANMHEVQLTVLMRGSQLNGLVAYPVPID